MRKIIRALAVCLLLQTAMAQVEPSSKLSLALRSAMTGRKGAAVVLDVRTGRILASYDLERAATRLATPGSSIKPFVLQALLESGRIDPTRAVACRRQLTIGGHRLDCTHPESAAMLTAADALAFSCNSYFVNAAMHFRRGELERSLQRFGLTAATGLAQNDAIGRIRQAQNLEQRQLLATGAVGIEVTPLELATAYRSLALLAIDRKLASVVLTGLRNSTDFGMGHLAHSARTEVAGKTGTASDPRDPHTHAWFAGFAPADHPSIVVVVFLDRGRGSVDAASVAGRMFGAFADLPPQPRGPQ